MPIQIPPSVSDLMDEVRETISHTRGVTDAELLRALSFGHRKIVRALRAVRPEHFTAKVPDFSLAGGVSELDLSALDPPVIRPVKLQLAPNGGDRRSILFRPRGLQGPDFEAMEHARSGMFSTILYDVLRGFFPQAYIAITAVTDESHFTVADPSTFALGALVQATGVGPAQTVGTTTVPNDYVGTVVGISGSDLTVEPVMADLPQASLTVIRRVRTCVLQLANPPIETLTGELLYQYDPSQLTAAMLLSPGIAPYRDPIVYYALSQLLQATNETDADRWFQKAEDMKAEVFQDADPLSAQGSEPMSSSLYGTDE